MPDLNQALKDFVATSNSGKYKDEKTLMSKFPELAGYDTQALRDYVATSNSGKYKDESALNSKFPEFFTQKKNPNQSGVSNSGNGSSGFPKFDINDYTSKKSLVKKEQNLIEKDNTSIAPVSRREVSIGQIEKDNKIAKPFIDKQKKLVKEKLSNFRNDTALPKDYETQIRQEVSDEVAEKGLLNTVKSGLKDWWNNTFDDEGIQIDKDVLAPEKEDSKKALLQKGYKPEDITPELLQKTAFDLKVKRLVDDKKLSLRNDYLDSLDDDDKEALQLDAYNEIKKTKPVVEQQFKAIKAFDIVIEQDNETLKEYEKKIKEGNLTEEDVLAANNLISELNQKVKNRNNRYKKFVNDAENLGTVEEEFDLFKRNYGFKDKGGRLLNSLADFGLGFAQFANMIAVTDPLRDIHSQEIASIKKHKDDTFKENFQKDTEEVHNVNDFIDYASGVIISQTPNLALGYFTGGTSMMAGIGISSAGNQYTDLTQSNLEGKTNYSEAQKIASSIISGGAEMIEGNTFKMLGAGRRVITAAINNKPTRDLLQKSLTERTLDFGKKLVKNDIGEKKEELTTYGVQKLSDLIILDLEAKNVFKNAPNEIASIIKDTGVMTVGLTAVPQVIGKIIKPFTAKTYVEKLDINNKKIKEIEAILSNKETSEDVKEQSKKLLDNLLQDNEKTVKEVVEKTSKLDTPLIDKVIQLEQESSKLRVEAQKVKEDLSLSKEQRKMLISEKETQYNSNEELREKIASGNATILDTVSTQEQTKLKDQASRELIKEKNPEGKEGKVTVTDEEITKRAVENYNKANAEKQQTAPTPETQPQAEVQKPSEAEKVETPKPQEATPVLETPTTETAPQQGREQLLSDLDNLAFIDEPKADNLDTSIPNDDTSKQPLGELTNDEFLEAIQNDNVSDERLTDIATKLSNNEKLSNREQKIATKYKDNVKQKTDATKQTKVANFTELTNDEYLNFIDNDKVSEDRLLNIAYKNENNQPLTKLEQDIYDSQKKKVDNLQKNNRSWLKDDSNTTDVEAEFDNLLSGEAEQRRKDGKYTKDGATYTRQEEQEDTPKGEIGLVRFADEVEIEFQYELIEEETLQPAHLNRKRNPMHFVPEMQPKNRKDQSSQVASDKIANDPKLKYTGENTEAYIGAPVVNTRGEVIQGNNRSEGLKKHYQRGGTKYKQQLIDNAAKFGFTPEQVQEMNKPVLVRRLKVDDVKAIELGNYDAKDIETGGSRKIDPVTTSRRIPQQEKSKMTESIFENTDTETTLTEAIKQNFKGFFDKVKKYLNPAQVETILDKTGVPSADGVQDLVKLVQQFIFDGANTDLSEQFERLSYNAKQGLLKSLPNLLSVSKENSLLTEVQNAIVAVSDFSTSKIENFEEWTNQTSIFEEQQTPKQKYSDLELKIARLLINAKKQSEISNVFKDYTNLVKDSEGDIFNPEGIKGISKDEAVSKVFKTNNQDGNKQQQRASSEQDGANDPKRESEPRQEDEPIRQSPTNEQGEANPDAGEQGVKQEVKPIRQLGTGQNVYFENDVVRVNDFKNGVLVNIQSKEDFGGMAQWNLKFDNPTEAVKTAKIISENFPKGVPNAILLEKWLEQLEQPKSEQITLNHNPKPTENKEVKEETKPDKEETPKTEPKKTAPKSTFQKFTPIAIESKTLPSHTDGTYQIYTRKIKENGEFVDVYLVPTIENKNSKGIGDDIYFTLEEAIQGIKDNIQREAKLKENKAISEEEKKKVEEELEAKKEKNKGKTNLELAQESRVNKVLDKQKRYDSIVMTRREYIEQKVKENANIVAEVETDTNALNLLKDEFDRINVSANQNSPSYKRYQELKNIIENENLHPKKTIYKVYKTNNTYSEITKIEYNYYLSLTKPNQVSESKNEIIKSDESLTEQENKEVKEETKPDKEQTPQPEAKQSKRKVSDEKIDKELDDAFKDLRDELGKLMSGVNPELAIKGAKIIAIYTKAGIYKLSNIVEDAYAKFGEISKELFDAIKQGYASYRETADDETYSKLDSNTRDFTYEYFKNRLANDEIRTTPKQEFITEIQTKLINKEKLNIVSIRKIAESFGLTDIKDTTLQEYVEMAIINEAKNIANRNNLTTKEKYDLVVELYETQPTISMRSSERIEKQQYSTPIPMSFLAGQFVRDIAPNTILEPSAGNGMMIFNVDEKNVIANEIDKVRLENLKEQGFRQVTNQDGTQPFNVMVDGIVTNPPFGSSPKKDYLGYGIAGLDEQMVVNALESMNDNGRASIVIGGHTNYNDNGTLKSQRAFLNYLYNYYNVVDIINIGGNLYQKQGTSFNTRMILIDGRKKPLKHNSENKIEFAPLKTDENSKVVTNFEELYERIETSKQKQNESILPPSTPIIDNNGEEGTGTQTNTGSGNRANPDQLNLPGDRAKPQPNGDRKRPNGRKNGNSQQSTGLDLFSNGDTGSANTNLGIEEQQSQSEGITDNTENGRTDDITGGIRDEFTFELSNKPNELDGNKIEVNIDSEKTPYPKQSKAPEIGSVVPTNMAQPLSNILSQFGDIDTYVQNKLNYKTKEDLFDALAAEQIDSVALAIYQMEKGKGLIIGDMTGVGKGRQAAAIIRYASLTGKKPIFFTEKPHLFSDLYRDLVDIGSNQLRPLIINQKGKNSDPTITDADGNKIYSPLSAQQIKAVLSKGKVPSRYDYVVLTYSQLNKDTKDGLSAKQSFYVQIAQNNIVVLDESHNAGGADSNQGKIIRESLPATSGATYLSGTFAKKPENMPLYALKTSMIDANMSQEELIAAIQNGGVPLQEIMSRNLVEMGEMIRRERDFTGVSIDWETLDENKEADNAIYDENIEIFNEIIDFQREHITPIIDGINDDLAGIQGGAKTKKGTADFGISNTLFASKTFNLTRQLMFSLKVDKVAAETIKELKAGRKPVIAIDITMETFLNEIGLNNTVSNYNYSRTLKKGIDGVFRYTQTDFTGDKEHKNLSIDDLSPEGKKKYYEIINRINNVSSNISISPIDMLITKIKEAGYSVGELTGRNTQLQINEDNTATVVKRQDKDKKKLARDFNNGQLDVLIINQVGATGISLHASKTFKDQRQRVMLSAQPQLNVSTEIQMRGRIDRTGQVIRGAYRYLISAIPAEQRLTMMFAGKLKSLDANTTSSQKSKTNEIAVVDFLNKYGDEIVLEYLKENREINDKILDPLNFKDLSDEKIDEIKPQAGDANKVSGKIALLSVKEQSEFYAEIAERYNAVIEYLNNNNSNDLEITTLALNAETKSSVIVVQGNNNGSPFSEDSIRETVEVDVLKKPLKSKEISEEIEKVLGGKTNIEYKNSNREKLTNYIQDLDAKEEKTIRENADKKYPAYKLKVEKEADRQKMSLAEKLLFVAEKLQDYSRVTDYKVNQGQIRNENKKNAISSMFSSFNVGTTYLVPSTTDVSLNTTYSQGIFLGYKMKERLNPSNITAVFATLDSRRKVEIPLSKIEYLNTIVAQTSRSDSKTLDANLDNWDTKRPTGTRRKAYIVTGNILQAFSVNKGQLVSYTTKEGQIKQGILLPETYKPEEQKMRVQIIKVIDKIQAGIPMVDASGDISIRKQNGSYQLDVPLSKVRGGKHFLDDKLRDMIVGRDFKQLGQGMVGIVTENRLEDVLGYLSSVHNVSVEIDTKPIQQRAIPKENENIVNEPSEGYQKNTTLALNKTKDGQEFLSLSEPGTEYSNSSQRDIQRQGDTSSSDNNRRSVQAIWTKYKNLQFKGTTKVKNAEDVAQIMSLLENKAVEHAFAIHIDKNGNSHIQFLSIGGVTGTVVDPRIVAAGVSKFNSVKVYLVHNHPSGKMQPSDADLQITKKIREGLNPLGITFEHIIMDTDRKEYVHIAHDNTFTVNTRGENTLKTPLKVTSITEQEILSNHFGKVTGSGEAFSIIQNFRFSAFPKNAMIVLNNSLEVVGNYVFSNGEITYEEILKFVGDTATATGVIFYGNQANNLSDIKDFQRNLKKLEIQVLDKIVTSSDNERVHEHYESMSDSGMLNEHLEQYGTGDAKFNNSDNIYKSYEKNNKHNAIKEILNQAQLSNSLEVSHKNNSHYWSIDGNYYRVADHSKPEGAFGFESYKNSEGKKDFRNYDDFYQFLKQKYDLSNKSKLETQYKKQASKFIKKEELNGEEVYRQPDGSMYSTIDGALNNMWRNKKELPSKNSDTFDAGDNNIVNEPSSGYSNKDLRLPQTIARQALDQLKEDTQNKLDNSTKLNNAIAIVQNSDWYKKLDDSQKARVNKTTIKSLLENAIKEINYLEDKIEDYKQQIKDNKLTARQVFDDIIAFLKTNQIKGKITPTEINRLIKSAAEITIKKDTTKALDDFMKQYEIIKEKALLRSDSVAKEKAEVEYVTPIVESLVASGYDLDMVLDYFDTISQKRMAEILYHKEKSKLVTEEERVNKTKEALDKQKQDLHNATYTSIREALKNARLYWFNLISDRSYVPASLMNKTGMQQTYYQFKNTKGYGHNAVQMYEKAYNKIWKGLTQEKIQLLHDTIQMMRIITIDNNREKNGLSPVQHPNNLSKIDAQAWLDNQKAELGNEEFDNLQKRAKEYFKAYQEVLDLKLEHGFISQETYDALNGLDYQPRMFLHHAVNFDGDLSFEQKQNIAVRSGLSKEQIKGLEDGSSNSLISDAQWLLSNSISTLYQDIADNTLNKLFIAEEFPKAKAKYDDLLSKPIDQLTKEEKRFIDYFKELSDKVIPNQIIGFNADNNNPIYKNETPNHFVNKYYWADGVKHQFFMEENLAQEFDGAKGLFLNESNKATVGNVTGSRLVKFFATGNNPLFVIVNTPRDFMWNIQVSEHYSTFIPLAIGQMTYQLFPSTYDFIKSKLGYENTDMNLYLEHGGSMDYLHKQGDIAKKSWAYNWIKKPVTSILGKNNQPIVEDKLRNNYLLKAVGALNEWSELAFRIATFRRSINASLKELGFENENQITDATDENGIVTQTRKEILDNIYRKATYDARSVLDFSQGGRLVKDLEEFIPYLNVGVQATRSYADAMKKRPISTTLKTFQLATGTTAAALTLAMFMLAGDDDEPEEEKGKTVERKYIEFIQGVSQETRSKYYLIPTKQRDEKGNRIAYKIAKDQLLIPYTNIVETLIENRIRTRSGFKEVSIDKIGNRLYKDIFEYNLSAKTIKDIPLFKAGASWYAGYDLYRNKPLDKYAKSEALEGMNNQNVEDFYKHFGKELEISPIRTKSAIESMITSPQSNPYLATGYEVMDYAFTDKSMEHLGKGVKEMLLKGIKNRTTTKSTEWTRSENLLQDTKDQQINAMLKEEATRQLFKDKAQEVIDGKITAEEVLEELGSQYQSDPNYRSYIKSFRTTIKGDLIKEGTDGMMQKIKREDSPGAKAIMIREIYGDINSPENAEVKQLLIDKGVINQATLNYLDKKTAN